MLTSRNYHISIIMEPNDEDPLLRDLRKTCSPNSSGRSHLNVRTFASVCETTAVLTAEEDWCFLTLTRAVINCRFTVVMWQYTFR